MDERVVRALAREEVEDRLGKYDDAFEQRLASAFQKALDIVAADYSTRIRRLEEDQARILRHLGISYSPEDPE